MMRVPMWTRLERSRAEIENLSLNCGHFHSREREENVMRTRWTTGLVGCAAAVLAIWVTATAARADLRVPGQPYRGPAKRPDEKAPPATTKTVSFEVMVATSGGSDTPTLIIPREAVKGLSDATPLPGIEGDRFANADAP